MNSKRISLVAITVIAAFVVGSVSGIQDIIAEDATEKKYNMANNVEIVGIFEFASGNTELVEFQVFTQETGFQRATETATFEVVKELNDSSPLLYKAADMSWKYNSVAGMDYTTEFDVTFLLSKDGEILRQFDYSGCSVDEYEVKTLFDKEEGWTTSKGFAVIDEFEISCEGYMPVNPTYEKTNGYSKIESKQLSSLDLIEQEKARLTLK